MGRDSIDQEQDVLRRLQVHQLERIDVFGAAPIPSRSISCTTDPFEATQAQSQPTFHLN
jgi:hypothetical protein